MLFKDFVHILLEQPNNPYPTVDFPFILGFEEKKTDDVPCICWNFLGATAENKLSYPLKLIMLGRWFISLKDWPLFQRTFVNKKSGVDFHLRNLLYIDTKKNHYKVKRSHLLIQSIILGIQPLAFLGGVILWCPPRVSHLCTPMISSRGFLILPRALGDHRSLYLFLGCSRWRELVRNLRKGGVGSF